MCLDDKDITEMRERERERECVCVRACVRVCVRVGPNVVIEWLTLSIFIREIPGLNLGPETGYLD
jgi:hypothetical protein